MPSTSIADISIPDLRAAIDGRVIRERRLAKSIEALRAGRPR